MAPWSELGFGLFTATSSIVSIFLAFVSLRRLKQTKARLTNTNNQLLRADLRRISRTYRASALFYGIEAIGFALCGLCVILWPLGLYGYPAFALLISAVLFFALWGWILFLVGLATSAMVAFAESSLNAKLGNHE